MVLPRLTARCRWWQGAAIALVLGGTPVLSGRAAPAAEAAGGNAASENQPLQIQADSGIEWQQDAHVYIARGNAVATRGTSEVHADTLIAHYREVKSGSAPKPNTGNTLGLGGEGGGNTEIYRVEAEGHVTLKRDAQTVVGDRAIYDVDKAIAVITGKNLKMTTATDVVTARDSLEWFDQKQIAVARGDAVAIRNGRTIKADILTAYMVKTGAPAAGAAAPAAKPGATGRPSPKKPVTPVSTGAAGKQPGAQPAQESKISRVDAQGHVVITNSLDTGRGDFGVYNADTGIATLIRNVTIERGKDVIRGQRGVIDLNNNVSRMLPTAGPGAPPQRVQGLLVREQSNAAGAAGKAGGKASNPAAAGAAKP